MVRAIVYFLKAGKHFKIGKTTRKMDYRIKELQTGNPYQIELIHYVDCLSQNRMNTLESLLHSEYKKFNVRGEWFNFPSYKHNELVLKMNVLSSSANLKLYKDKKYEIFIHSKSSMPKQERKRIEYEKRLKELRSDLNLILMNPFLK